MSAAPHEGEARPSSAVDAAGVQRLVDWFLDCNPDPGTPAAMAQALAKALTAERARADGLARERDAERTRADEWRDKHAHLDRSRESEVASLYKTIATAEASLAAERETLKAARTMLDATGASLAAAVKEREALREAVRMVLASDNDWRVLTPTERAILDDLATLTAEQASACRNGEAR